MSRAVSVVLAIVALGAAWLGALATLDAFSRSGDADPVFLVAFVLAAAVVAVTCGVIARRLWRSSARRPRVGR
jgi:biotin transporter BioY